MLRKLTRRSKSRGFTLIEMLVVVLIIAILLAVAIPLYLQSVANSAVQACRENIRTIANVSMAFRTSSADHLFPTTVELDGQLQSEGNPVLANWQGPNDCTYTYDETNAKGDPPSFTIACAYGAGLTHGTYDSTTGQITP